MISVELVAKAEARSVRGYTLGRQSLSLSQPPQHTPHELLPIRITVLEQVADLRFGHLLVPNRFSLCNFKKARENKCVLPF